MAVAKSLKAILTADPTDPLHKVVNSELLAKLLEIEAQAAINGALYFEDALADLPTGAEGDTGFVLDDTGTPANNGIYLKGASAWAKTAALPAAFGDISATAIAAYAEQTAADVVLTHADAAATAADVVLTHADAAATAADRVQTGLDRTATELAAAVAGMAPYGSEAELPTGGSLPADGTWAAVYTANGMQAWRVVSGAWALIGWVSRVTFFDATALRVSTLTGLDAGTVIYTLTDEFTYVVADAAADPYGVDPVDGYHVQTAGGVKLIAQPGADGKINVRALFAIGDGAEDDTSAFQLALDIGRPFIVPAANYLITDTLVIDGALGCDADFGARSVANASHIPRIKFTPATKRDVFTWKTNPTSYFYTGVRIRGLSLVGYGPGAAAVFNLPGLYKGELEAFLYSGIDHYAIVERWLHCYAKGNVNGFRVSGIRITNTGLSGNNVTTKTNFDIYISGGAVGYTTYGYDIETFSILSGNLTNIVESVECAVRMARGNTVDSYLYTENAPRTNAGSLFEIGKIDTGTPDGTTIFRHCGTNLHGTNVAAPGYDATRFADIDYCSSATFRDADIKRFGGLLRTTANSKNILIAGCYTIGVEKLELSSTDIYDFQEISFQAFRPYGMLSGHGVAMQSTQVMASANRSPTGLDRPRWAYDKLYSSTSRSFWISTGDGLFDWRLLAPQVYEATAIVSAGTIVPGVPYRTTITVYGALLGDFAEASYGPGYPGLDVSARVVGTDAVEFIAANLTTSDIITAAATVRILVTKSVLN